MAFRRAFTIVELLVVIGILGLLVGLLFPALVAVRSSAAAAREGNAARQLMAAWTAYAAASNDAVLVGYKTDLVARNASGQVITGPSAWRYPWRLLPYLDYQTRGLYVGLAEDVLEDAEYGDDHDYLVSLFPSLGLNSAWIGGDESEGGFTDLYLETFGTFYVTSIAQVTRPDGLLVFASAHGTDPESPLGNEVVDGYFRVTSPSFTSERWDEQYDPATPGQHGFVSARHGDGATTAFVDGHVETLTIQQLRDMRYWANGATRFDWVLE